VKDHGHVGIVIHAKKRRGAVVREKNFPNSGSNEFGELPGSFLYPRGPEFVFSNGRSA
jgi:hypothetical protein